MQTADVNIPKLHAVIGNEIQSFAYITPMAAAPNISSEQVIIVASSNNPNGESIAKNQVTTAYDEGGAQRQIGVLEIGYGTSSPYMTMAGQQLAQSKVLSRTGVCIVTGYYSTSCAAGVTYVGFYYIIDLSGYQSGKFTFANTSHNNNSVTGYTSITIK